MNLLTKKSFSRKVLGLAFALAVSVSNLAQSQTTASEFRIGFQKGAAILVLAKKQQIIEKRLKSIGVSRVKWVEFQFGPPMLEALGAGAIDLASVGDTPPIFAQAGGSNLVYVAATPSAQHAVLVPKNSSIKTLADLKGKRVAFAKGSSAQNVAIKALGVGGLTIHDITPAYLSPADATAAFNGGTIDAWIVWDPYFSIAQQHYDARAIADTSDRRLTSASYFMAHRDFATQHSKELNAVLDEIKKLTLWVGTHRDVLATEAAEATGMDVKTWSKVFARAEFTWSPITAAHIIQQQESADTFQALGIIPKKIVVSEYVWHDPAVAVKQ